MRRPAGRGDGLPPLPLDSCPYPRPFPAEFDLCPAFAPRAYIGFDLQYRPLRSVLSCRHLEAGSLDRRHYGRCSLGDAQARQEWAAGFRTHRLERLRQLSVAMQAHAEPELRELYLAKGDQLRNRGDRAAITRLQEAAARVEETSDAWLATQRSELEAVGLPYEATRSVIRLSLEALISTDSGYGASSLTDGQPAEFPPSVREFLRVRREGQAVEETSEA